MFPMTEPLTQRLANAITGAVNQVSVPAVNLGVPLCSARRAILRALTEVRAEMAEVHLDEDCPLHDLTQDAGCSARPMGGE